MKRFLRVLTAILVISILLPIGLVDAQSTDKKAMPNLKKPLQTPPPASKELQTEWQKVLEAGKKEGKVAVYVSSISPAMRKQAPVFAKQFGIEIEVMAGRGNELLMRLETEKKAGLNIADVVIGLHKIRDLGRGF